MTVAPWTPTSCRAWLCTLAFVACSERPADPTSLAPSVHRDGGGHRTVVVDPDGRHDATTIQAGIDMAPAGGRVQVPPGTYAETQHLQRAHARRHEGGTMMKSVYSSRHPEHADAAVQVTGAAPVTIRGLTVRYTGLNGIRGDGPADLTVERATVVAINPPLGSTALISVANNPPTGAPAGSSYARAKWTGARVRQLSQTSVSPDLRYPDERRR